MKPITTVLVLLWIVGVTLLFNSVLLLISIAI